MLLATKQQEEGEDNERRGWQKARSIVVPSADFTHRQDELSAGSADRLVQSSVHWPFLFKDAERKICVPQVMAEELQKRCLNMVAL